MKPVLASERDAREARVVSEAHVITGQHTKDGSRWTHFTCGRFGCWFDVPNVNLDDIGTHVCPRCLHAAEATIDAHYAAALQRERER